MSEEPLVILTYLGPYANNYWYINENNEELFLKDVMGCYIRISGLNREDLINDIIEHNIERLLEND